NRGTHLTNRGSMRRAIIEYHGNIRAQHALNFHGLLRTKEKQRAVQMRAELHPVWLDFGNLREAEHLESATIGKYRVLPVDESVQPPRRADDIKPGADTEVIRIAQDDLRAHLDEFARVK